MKTSDKVKTVVVFLFVLVLLFIAVSLSAQTNPFVYSISKDGKETHKECLSVSVTDTDVIFIVTGTSYQAFRKLSDKIWIDAANQKVIQRVVQTNGTVVFWKTDKKAFYYSTTPKKIQQ
jgi:hypothetical protein